MYDFIVFRKAHNSAQMERRIAKNSSWCCVMGWSKVWCKRIPFWTWKGYARRKSTKKQNVKGSTCKASWMDGG